MTVAVESCDEGAWSSVAFTSEPNFGFRVDEITGSGFTLLSEATKKRMKYMKWGFCRTLSIKLRGSAEAGEGVR